MPLPVDVYGQTKHKTKKMTCIQNQKITLPLKHFVASLMLTIINDSQTVFYPLKQCIVEHNCGAAYGSQAILTGIYSLSSVKKMSHYCSL